MRTRLHAPDAITDPIDRGALMCHVAEIGFIVQQYTGHDKRDVKVKVLRVIGWACELGGNDNGN